MLSLLFIIYLFCLPSSLFKDPTCMILDDNQGNLLGARIAADGQWRFPYNEQIPEKYARAVIEFEDKHFYYHPGIDPSGIGRAIWQNLKHRRVVSGGSTISMQVIRLSRKGQSRTILEKIIEAVLATRLELRFSKKEILNLYASNAPFGGNVVGIDAASWRYFGKNPKLLTWAEAATLAVLPNSPALIHPGRNRNNLLEKRNKLLDKLQQKSIIDQLTCQLAKDEPLPEKPHTLPRAAPHLLDRAFEDHFKDKREAITRLQTTIDAHLQQQITAILEQHHLFLEANHIHNLAALVLEVETGNVVAYVGNVQNVNDEHSSQVDIVRAPRSSGSIFKPLLYALMQQEGLLLPQSVVSDIPTQMAGYKPENFYETYDGIISSKRALVRSLNVPFVRMLQQFGLEKFHFWLRNVGLTTINRPPEHYGLSLVLGGAETSLWEVTNLYAGMARTVNHFQQYQSRYIDGDFRQPNYIKTISKKNTPPPNKPSERRLLSASACYLAFDAMQNVERPTSTGEWEAFQSSKRIAWKTGTSFGFRDAWAIGVTPRYAVGVWAGNADGEGRPELVGVKVAAPVLFDIFNQLNSPEWFDPPYDEMIPIETCRQSGFRATSLCEKDTIWAANNGIKVAACTYHQLLHLDETRQWQVHSDCENPTKMQHTPWFVLPPIEEFYYKSKNPNYTPPPLFRTDCQQNTSTQHIVQLIYPRPNAQIYVPIDLDGKPSKTVFKAAHRNASTNIYWHLDDQYMGTTKDFHNLELSPNIGRHRLTLIDEKGNRIENAFEILTK